MYAVASSIEQARNGQFTSGPFQDYFTADSDVSDYNEIIWDLNMSCRVLSVSQHQEVACLRLVMPKILEVGKWYTLNDGQTWTYEGSRSDRLHNVFHNFVRSDGRGGLDVSSQYLHLTVMMVANWYASQWESVRNGSTDVVADGPIQPEKAANHVPDSYTREELVQAFGQIGVRQRGWDSPEWSDSEVVGLVLDQINLNRRLNRGAQ